MEILGILLGLVVALLGYPVGLLLKKIAKEEIKSGKKYFKIMQKIIIVLFAISLFFGSFVLSYSLIFLYLLPTAALGKDNKWFK